MARPSVRDSVPCGLYATGLLPKTPCLRLPPADGAVQVRGLCACHSVVPRLVEHKKTASIVKSCVVAAAQYRSCRYPLARGASYWTPVIESGPLGMLLLMDRSGGSSVRPALAYESPE